MDLTQLRTLQWLTVVSAVVTIVADSLRNQERIEVRFHRERLRNWLHIVDADLVYVGLFARADNGLGAPVLLARRCRPMGLCDRYLDQWQGIWPEALSHDVRHVL